MNTIVGKRIDFYRCGLLQQIHIPHVGVLHDFLLTKHAGNFVVQRTGAKLVDRYERKGELKWIHLQSKVPPTDLAGPQHPLTGSIWRLRMGPKTLEPRAYH